VQKPEADWSPTEQFVVLECEKALKLVRKVNAILVRPAHFLCLLLPRTDALVLREHPKLQVATGEVLSGASLLTQTILTDCSSVLAGTTPW
jgi:hypothetical protein